MSRPLHIVQLANFYGPGSGGLRTAIDRLAAGYCERGHRVTTIVPSEFDGRFVVGERTTVGIASPVAPLLGGGYRLAIDRTAVAEQLAADPPDVIELSDKTTLTASIRRDPIRATPVVLFSHERLDAVIARAVGTTWFDPLVDRYNRRLARRVDTIVCASRYAATEFERIDVEVSQVPLGVDLATFRPDHSSQPTTSPGTPLRLIAVVRLSPEKDPWLLVETSRRLFADGVDHELVVHGDGPLRERLVRMSTGLPIRFGGFVEDRRRLAADMASADVGIAPGPLETFGLAALELLASGTPVVVPSSGALAEIADGRVAVAADRTPESFAAAIRTLASRNRGDLSDAARSLACRFSWDRTISSMLGIHTDATLGRTGISARTCSPHRGSSRSARAGSDPVRPSTGAA
ncbi:MAG: hypothetical protein RLZZ01_2163 [Actinomycetota bacterium]